MPQIFGCPYCQKPFGVPDDAAGQKFACPSCDAPVEVPALAPPPEPEVYRCPHCDGKFGVDSSMYGTHAACPHCANHVAIGPAAKPKAPVEAPVEAPLSLAPINVISPSDSLAAKRGTGEQAEPPNKTAERTSKRTSKRKSKPSRAVEQSATQAARDSKDPGPQAADSQRDRKVKGADSQTRAAAAGPQSNSDLEALEETESSPSVSAATTSAKSMGEPESIRHLLPPTFDVPDPVRFPHKAGANEVLLPDGAGGYQAAQANVVTITYQGKVYHLTRMTPEQRRRRQIIHNTIAIVIAVVLIFLTLQAVGLFS